LRDVGDHWERRRGGIAHEHLISSAMRHLLGSFLRVYSGRKIPVRLLFATTSGDRHEIGILAAAMLAASHGLSVSYVGPDLPAEEIVEAVKSSDAQVLVLGLTFSGDRETAARELRTLTGGLPATVELWAGGPGAAAHAAVLNTRGLALADFDAYLLQLERIGGRA
jgi:methanogenic corrinoid protein MtbC1